MAVNLGTLRDDFLARRHTALLAAIVTAFAVRPLIGESGDSPFVFSIAVVVLMLVVGMQMGARTERAP